MARVVQAAEFATEGEQRAADALQGLPSDWVVICDKTLVTRDARSFEIDFVLDAGQQRLRVPAAAREEVRALLERALGESFVVVGPGAGLYWPECDCVMALEATCDQHAD